MSDKYKVGFGLINVKCANCAFDCESLDYDQQAAMFPLKELLFAQVETLHDEDVKIQHKKYKCTVRKLTIAFCEVAQEI